MADRNGNPQGNKERSSETKAEQAEKLTHHTEKYYEDEDDSAGNCSDRINDPISTSYAMLWDRQNPR